MTTETSIDVMLDEAVADARRRFTDANPASLQQFRTNAGYMPGGNSRSVLFYTPFPLTIVRGDAATVWDADGHRYTDFIGEYTAGLYGHSAPEIREAVDEAMRAGISLTGHNLLEGKLARLLCERFPAVELVRFTNSGTEANLMAITAALRFTGRRTIVVFSGAYHGGVLGFGAQPGPTTVPFDFIVLPYNDAEGAVARIEAEEAGIAAILLEPMLGSGGCIPAEPGFLHALRDAATRAGALLIADEVMTSRMGGQGLCAKVGVTADLMTMGKYLGGGMSFGAFGGRADVMSLFDPRTGPLAHSGTFNNNVVTMAAGYAGLTKLFPPHAADALFARGNGLRDRLNALAVNAGMPLQFTGLGSLMNAHFVTGDVRRPEDVAAADPRLRELLFLHLLEAGFYSSPRGFIVLSLPVNDADIDAFVDAIERFVATYQSLLARSGGALLGGG